ncbi:MULTISPECIES: hypothetical protein [unclassified Haloferax]|uniref:hypothetical protein n=1 Tax=unclassified Haloferax TaxID=2625095 RepID=UPI002874F3B1|nr:MULTISPECIES: hypothetical protein [unclassified Haloferax]MDS0243784.1 hypothetical protein [Haloferax sp. S2CR25]MDS0446905.1 hypothetical protein [Haloferax sp. S2CR25-2]
MFAHEPQKENSIAGFGVNSKMNSPWYANYVKGKGNVENAQADRTSNSATVKGDADTDALVNAVNEAGYTASV